MTVGTALTIAGTAVAVIGLMITLLGLWVRAELRLLAQRQDTAAERIIGEVRAAEEALGGRVDGLADRVARLEGPQLQLGR